MEKIHSTDNVSQASLPSVSQSLCDELTQYRLLLEQNKHKKKKFNELWKNIRFLETLSFSYPDITSCRQIAVDGKKIMERIYSKFSDFFESDKHLLQISPDCLEKIDEYLIRILRLL